MLEKQIEARLKKELEKRGALVFKFVSPGQAGVPDRLVVLPDGQCVFVELKQENGRLRKLQEWQIQRLRDSNARVAIVRGLQDVLLLVDALFPTHNMGGDDNAV